LAQGLTCLSDRTLYFSQRCFRLRNSTMRGYLSGAWVLNLFFVCQLVTARNSSASFRGCDDAWNNWNNAMNECTAASKKLQGDMEKSFAPMEAEYQHNKAYLKTLDAEWEDARDDLRSNNPYLRPQFLLQMQGRHLRSRAQLMDPKAGCDARCNGYSTDIQCDPANKASCVGCPACGGTVGEDSPGWTEQESEDVKCVCYDDDKCNCWPRCRLRYNTCKAQYMSQKEHGKQRYFRYKKRIMEQRERIRAMKENIRRTRAADPNNPYRNTDNPEAYKR